MPTMVIHRCVLYDSRYVCQFEISLRHRPRDRSGSRGNLPIVKYHPVFPLASAPGFRTIDGTDTHFT